MKKIYNSTNRGEIYKIDTEFFPLHAYKVRTMNNFSQTKTTAQEIRYPSKKKNIKRNKIT